MRKMLYILLLLMTFSCSLRAQDIEKTEKRAKKYFNKAYYDEALPLLNTLIKYKDKDPYINYMYAVTTIETGNPVPNKAYQSIKYALDNQVDEYDIDYYWGRANEELFKVKQAAQIYEKIVHNPSTDKSIKELAGERLEACREAMSLHQDVISNIIWQREATYQSFYKLYDFDTHKYGTLLLTPEELNNSNSETDLAFIPPSKDFIYFSRYNKKSRSKEIYRAPINGNGEYGEAEKLNNYVNSSGDEEFPSLTANLSVLFYSSNGHRSIGKEDIFRSTYSMSGDWSRPDHIGLPLNSPFNDFAFFFLPDRGIAYFTSDRYHADGKLTVYKVKLNPRITAMLNRTFYAVPGSDNSETLTESPTTPAKSAADTLAGTSPDSTRQEDQVLSAKENALRIINNKKKINRMIDSAFFFAGQWKNKTQLLQNQKDKAIHIAYNKNKQSKALFGQYLELCQQFNDASDPKKLQTLQPALSSKLQEATLAEFQADEASKLKGKIAKTQITSQKIMDSLNTLSGAMQLDAAVDKYDKVRKNYDKVKQLLQANDSLHTYERELQAIKTASPPAKDLLSMHIFSDRKIQMINNAIESEMLVDEAYAQASNDIHELMNMAIISYKKLINTTKTPQQKKYLIKDIQTFAGKAINKQQEEINRLTELINSLAEDMAYAGEEIAGTEEKTATTETEVDNIIATEDTEKEEIAGAGNTEEEVTMAENTATEETSGIPDEQSATDNHGIKYKIQLGAFSSGTKLEKFSGLPELSKEDIPGRGLFRLFSGNYTGYEAAKSAKDKLQKKYPGAFIVAFESGEKIPVSLALKKQKGSPADTQAQGNQEVVAKGDIPESVIPQKGETVAGKYKTDVKQNSGKLYYIQLGTFGQPKVSAQLYNINPLLYEVLPTGLFRYFTGPYKSIEEAKVALNSIHTKGAVNAFVVGYDNGNKVHLDNPTATTPPETTEPPDTGTVYEIQLGAFSKIKPEIWKKDMQQRTGTSIHMHTTSAGIHIYTAGSFSSVEEANNYKQNLIEKGFSGIFVVAFRKGKKVPLH